MSFPAYPSYRDSGVEWLGYVPSHWNVTKLKRVAAFQTGWTPPTGRDDLYGGQHQWVTIGDMGQRVVSQSVKQITDEAVELVNIPPSPTGSLLFSFKLSIGQVAFAGCDLFTNEAIATFLPGYDLDLSFGYYALPVFVVQNAAENIYGAKLLNQELIRNATIAMPSPPEQVAIAAFLDRETAKIDALIEEQRRLIALLKEKRQAVISHAVTKGVDPHAPMKDSGIEWLGKVPAHWQTLPLRRVVRQFVDYRGATPNKVSEGVPLITATQIKHGRIDHSLDPVFISEEEYAERMTRGFPAVGDLLLTTEAPLGEVALVDDERVAPGQRIILMKMADHLMTSGYLHAHFRSDFGQSELWTRASGSTASGIRADRLRGSAVLVPPLDEQQRIVSHIQRQTSAFDNVFAAVARGIQLLNERRAALISAAVTGKIDVRSSAKVLPFPIDRTRARALVGTEIIERSAGQPTFGRVKFQKMAFLAEGHVGISELAGCYTRAAAGPLDGALIDDMERGAHSIVGIERDQPGGSGTTNSYIVTQPRGAHRQELVEWLGRDRTAKLDKLIADFAPLNTKQAEAVATLYGVWNDLLRDGATPSDDEIITGFLDDWHPEKRKKFRAGDLPEWLSWMRRHGIVPTGSGPKTTTGRLFV